MKLNWIELLILCLIFSAAECGFHSLQFLSSGLVKSTGRPVFEQLLLYDGVEISHCDSRTRQEQLKPTLETKHLPKTCAGARADILIFLSETTPFINRTVGVVQRRRGCIQSDDGSVSAFEAWAVNGMDSLTFDPESQMWTSQSPSSETVRHRWNKDKERNFAFQYFIRHLCPEMIQKITLRSVNKSTELRVFGKPTAYTDQALLRCHVTTTDKSVSSVHLVGDAAPQAIWTSVTGPVPSGDGCVILRLTARIYTQKPNTYGCTVQTGSDNKTVYWDGKTLDGTDLANKFNSTWKVLSVLMGLGFIIIASTILFYGMIVLRKCDKKIPVPKKLDPQMMRFIEDSLSPELKNIALSFVFGSNIPEKYKESLEEWAKRMKEKDLNYYDPDYFAGNSNVSEI
ncbi:major histocompatibility complex class I-related gene protein-like isoform X1 [Sphaeramia orbicularis]|uniref:major histocompatibility complex class I-related gene protein-like isoform X1 n=2 Tax=Sphaeramia orbicularis TaxID=375764 RepID=UPI00117D9761|nr:major histocompatibility complex class I-related gene protein-like isoform X1 [Sphaeramia orbicularis]